MFNWGNQNAINTSNVDNSVLVIKTNSIFIISFRILPKPADWKSAVLINTKEIRSSSIDRNIQE